MANPCPGVGVGLGFVAMIGIIYTLASKEWKVNSQTSSSITNGINAYEGLWVRCTSSAGQLRCDNYDEPKWNLAGELRGQRAMMVLALLTSLCGVITGSVGLQCITMMKESKSKMWTGRSGGGSMLLAALFTITAVSWYAAGVVDDFEANPDNNQFVYEFGSALYVGWISGGLALISGILMLFCNKMVKDDDSKPYSYNSPQKRTPAYV